MKNEVIVFPVWDDFVILGKRMKDPWRGRFSGFGGKIEDGDSGVRQRGTIELKEESGIIVPEEGLIKVAEFKINILNKGTKILHVLITYESGGKLQNTEEMQPKPFYIGNGPDKLPFKQMVSGDEFWVSQILAGKYLTGTIFRDERLNFLGIEMELTKPHYFQAA